MLLSLKGISKSFGERELFSGIDLEVEKQEKVGLVGVNGVGKTTLFKIITGELEPDSGSVLLAAGARVGYLQQHVCEASDRTAYEETLTVFGRLTEYEKELENLRLQISETADPVLIEKRQALEEKFQSMGGLTYESRTRAALKGMGFSDDEQNMATELLSGGQRSKIGLCKLLLSKPQIMLLDEPTNHLDISSIEWLEEYIIGSESAAIIISHDRYFLDRVTVKTAEIENRRLFVTGGNYTRYLQLKEERRLSEQREYDNTMREVHRIEGIIEQQRRWNREKNIKTAESKEKQIERLTKGLKKPEDSEREVDFCFKPVERSGDEVLTVSGIDIKFDDNVLLTDASFLLLRGSRTFIMGDNGCGKTSLLRRILAGIADENDNSVRVGAKVSAAYFDQHGANLDPKSTVFDEVHNAYPKMGNTEVRNALAAFLFTGDDVFKPVGELSGGERARVALCKMMLSGANLFILDEPTNHLDISSRTVLENALKTYDGTVLAVSHDRYFINSLATDIFAFQNKSLCKIHGNYDDFVNSEGAQKPAAVPKREMGEGGKSYHLQKKKASERRRLETAAANAEKKINTLENERDELQAQLENPEIAADYLEVARLSGEIDAIEKELEKALEEWETAINELSSFEEDA